MRETHVRDPHLADPVLPGNRPIPAAARGAALNCLLDVIGTALNPGEARALIAYAAYRFERGEVEGALRTLTLGCDMTGAYRLTAILHTVGSPEHG